MSLDVNIVDPVNNRRKTGIDNCGALSVVVHPHPPINTNECIQLLPFKQFFTTDGTENGSSDMLVDGSTTNVDFFVQAIQDFDLYIKNLAVLIVDKDAKLKEFGHLAPLTNGLELFYESQDTGRFVVDAAIQTNHDFVRLALYEPMIDKEMRLKDVIDDQEGFIPVIDFNKIFGMQYGLRLRKNTQDRIVFTVKDDITAIDQMDIIAYGIRIDGEDL